MYIMLEKMALYFQYPFVWRALAVGVLIALCSALLGVTLVRKRFSFIGDGLAHVAFGAMAAASALRLGRDMPFILAVTVLCAVFLLRGGQNAKIKGDAAIAMLSNGALAAGYLLMHMFPSGANVAGDVCGTLFGSVSLLVLSEEDVWLCAGLAASVLAAFLFFYHKIFAVTFDEEFAKASGMETERYNLMIAAIIAAVIVLAMKLVGALLISALLVFPALTAMRLRKSFLAVAVWSAAVSVFCMTAGFLLSLLAGTPVGATIVAADAAAFIAAAAASARGGNRAWKGGAHGKRDGKPAGR